MDEREEREREEEKEVGERHYLYPHRKECDLLPGGALWWAVGLTLSARLLFCYSTPLRVSLR